jgi:hypothetical protein
MKSSILPSLIFFVFSFIAFASPAQAQNYYYVNAIHAWTVHESGPNDYKLAFVIPNSKRWRVEGTTLTSRNVLRTVSGQDGGIINYESGSGQRTIIVTAGGRARFTNGFFGTLNMWRNTVRVATW